MTTAQPTYNIEKLTFEIAFSKIKGINLSTAGKLLERIDSPEQFFNLPETTLSALSGIDHRLTNTNYRKSLIEEARREVEFVTSKSLTATFCKSQNYPRRLLDCDDAPAMLYSVGDCNLNSIHNVAIVGTRHATAYGIDFVKHLVKDLAQKLDSLVIISGLAYGIDIAAHRAALENNVPTAAVVAHGLNTIYPAEHRTAAANIVKNGGAIITEYGYNAPIHRGNFLARNRIVAGLSDVVVVVESDSRGGAMSTARIASAYNHEVMAVPGRTIDTYSRGCNDLIAEQTASIIRSADDLITAMNWTSKPMAETQTALNFEITPEQKSIADHIMSHPDHTVNEICIALAIPFNRLSSILFEMEMADLIMALPGGKYSVTAKL